MKFLLLAAALANVAPAAAGVPPSTNSEALHTFIGGGNRTLVVTIVREHGGQFTMDASRFRTIVTDVRTHASRILAASASAAFASHMETVSRLSVVYRNAQTVRLRYPFPASIGAAMYECRFDVDDGVRDEVGAALRVEQPPDPGLVYVPPMRPSRGRDANVLALQRFVGKSVYGIGGGISEHCSADADINFEETQSARIVAIRRKYGVGPVWDVGGSTLSRYDDSGAPFLAIDPIEIVFATPHAGFAGGSFTGSPPDSGDDDSTAVMPDFTSGDPARLCPRGTFQVSDAWEFERLFSLDHPYRNRGWSVHFRNAVREGKIIAGMTPSMVAQVWGYPSHYGFASDLRRETLWTYEAAPPTGHAVRFRNGRVVAITEPSMLP